VAQHGVQKATDANGESLMRRSSKEARRHYRRAAMSEEKSVPILNCLPLCMMPDGGEACAGFINADMRVYEMQTRIAELKAQLAELNSPVQLSEWQKMEQQLTELREAVRAAFDCEMIPKSSASDGGASKYSEQVMVADRLRAALQKGK